MTIFRSKISRVTLVVVAVSFSVRWCLDAAEPRPVWRTDFSSAWAEAKKQNRPMLVHFYAEWCGPCRQMERSVLHSDRVTKLLKENFIAVKVDSDNHPDLIQHFNVRALPSDIIVDPKGSGTLLSQTEGFQSAERYLQKITGIAAKYEKPTKTIVAKNADPESNQTPNVIQSDNKLSSKASPASQLPEENNTAKSTKQAIRIGLDGYSPVSLAKSRDWRKGKSEFAHEYQGIVYHLSTASELQEFSSKPNRFAPQLLGCDPVVLWNTDRAVSGSTQFGAYFDGELFLFTTDKSRKQFKSNPLRFTRTRHVLRVDQIEGTRIR